MKHFPTIVAALLVAAALLSARPPIAFARQPEQPAAAAEHTAPQQESGIAREAEQGREEHGDGWMGVIAKAFNFALLAAVLVYFLRTPLMDHLQGRIAKVREDLVTAAETREAATKRLAEIHARLAALPSELDALKARGAEEVSAERVRIAHAAEAERERLLEHTRREIDMRLRIAKRDLIEHAATLAVEVATARIRAAITPADQERLLDRYAVQVAQEGRS